MEDLAAENGVPPNYLVQILIELKIQNIVQSIRGKEGGYMLARSPSEITLADVIHAVHGKIFDSSALMDSQCPEALRQAWIRLQKTLDDTAGEMNFQKLLDDSDIRGKMYYI